MGFPVILQVVGYQNSGKTTVITRLIKSLNEKGYRTAVLKHHGHEEGLIFHDQGKDTFQHRQSGAVLSGITSQTNSLFTMEHSLPLEKQIEMISVLNLDCILIEGYKKVQLPRVVLCRDKKDSVLIETSENVLAVISHVQNDFQTISPQFCRDNSEEWIDFLTDYICRQRESECV